MIVEGINVVRELLNECVKIDKIIAQVTNNNEVIKLLDKARAVGVSVSVLEKNDFLKYSKGENQGIIAYIPNFKYAEIKDIFLTAERKNQPPFIVILDGITDPHNLGAIIRTCECAGVHGVIIPKNRACEVNATVFKTSAGAVSHMKVVMETNLTNTIKDLKNQGVWVYGLEAGGKSIYNADFSYPTALVIGSEGKGVSQLVSKNCDEILSLDMFGKINSLNASNAGAIAIYEVVRQRRS